MDVVTVRAVIVAASGALHDDSKDLILGGCSSIGTSLLHLSLINLSEVVSGVEASSEAGGQTTVAEWCKKY